MIPLIISFLWFLASLVVIGTTRVERNAIVAEVILVLSAIALVVSAVRLFGW